MDKKMTSGEIAKKAGISQKAVRLYDEKGLLKPSDYSEGNYRLYDSEALLVLEKILALKQIGFSLEEIKENLVGSSSKGIRETLQEQIDMMEAKRYELEKAITRMKAVLSRSENEPDWDDVAEILKSMQVDQNKDAGHFFALDHTKGQLDWYVKIFRYLQVAEGERVLDLGCGYSKVWRNNWEEIPEKVQIDAYDLRGSWADDFEKFVKENEEKLAKDTNIALYFEDVEEQATWKHIEGEEKYSMVIAHYIADVLKAPEIFVKKAAGVLKEGGLFSFNTYGNAPRPHYGFWYDVFEKLALDTRFLDAEVESREAEALQCKAVLDKYFKEVSEEMIESPFYFDSVDDILTDLERCIPGHEAFVEANKSKLIRFFEEKLSEGSIVIPHDGGFWRCIK